MSAPSPEPAQSAEQARWFAEEVQPHEPALRAYLRGSFPTLPDVDDLVQESYYRLWKSGAAAGRVRSAKAFLFATARHVALDIFRRRRIVSIKSVEEIDTLSVLTALSVLTDSEGVPEAVGQAQELQLLAEAVRALPDRTRHVLTLRKLFGLPQKDIAARLGISEHTVEAHVIKGMRRCTEYFRRRGLP
jgi:RNA polymerase sigma factor (sigma-70 family)